MARTPNILLRERLIAAVDARWDGGMGVLVGGPGLGKSTVVRQSMLESATLERGAEVLIRCRADWAASAVHAEVCRQLEIEEESAVSGVDARAIAEYLWSVAPKRSGIVFDDVHLLDESGISYVLELRRALPSNAHLLVACREHPMLTALLMTAEPSFVLDGGDLLFTDAEVDAFAAEASIDPSTLQSAGGWPAVLVLTISAGSDVAGAYLYQKVLAGLSRRQQGDLAVGAALHDLNLELADQVLEGPVRDLIGIPLVEGRPSGGVIVHDLWREPLQGLVAPERLQQARQSAAEQAEADGDVDRAVVVLVEGAQHGAARQVIMRHIAKGADRVPVDRVDRWLRLLTSPDQALLRQLLEFLRSGLAAGEMSEHDLNAITTRCRQADELDLEALVCEVRFANAWAADDTEACVAVAERLIDLHELGVDQAAAGQVARDVTVARSSGDNGKVLALIAEARASQSLGIGPDWNITLELETLVALGRPFEALDIAEDAERRLADRKVRSVTYGITYWFAGRPNEALRSLDAILREPGRFSSLERSWRATLGLFRGYRGFASEPEAAASTAPEDERYSTYSRVCESLAASAQAIHAGDEDQARLLINDLAEQLPPTEGFTMQAWSMGAAMWYSLRPDDRSLLDAVLLDGMLGEAGALFRSFVAGRDTGSIPDDLIQDWPTAAQVGTILPARWAAEIALRLGPKHEALAAAVLDGLEGEGRPALELLAAGGDDAIAKLATASLGVRPHSPTDPVVVRLLGTPALVVPGFDEASDWRRGRVRALFGFLATRRRATREAAIEALWPGRDVQAGRSNLRVTLSYLTRTLEPGRSKATPPWFVRSDGEMLELRTEGLDLDVLQLRQALQRAAQHRSDGLASKAIEELRIAVNLYAGPVLEGLDDEWIMAEQASLERDVLNACLRLVALLQAGRSSEASHWARRAIEIDPLSVDAHELFVETLAGGPPHEIDAARARLQAVLEGG